MNLLLRASLSLLNDHSEDVTVAGIVSKIHKQIHTFGKRS